MSMDNKVPEIRFRKSSGKWIKENISNIAPLQRGFDLPRNGMKVGVYPVVMSNGVNGFHNVFKAKAPGIVTGRSGTIGNIHYIDIDYWPHNTTLWVTNFHKNVPLFIYYLYVKLDIKKFATGSGVPTLNRNDVHDQLVAFPTDATEQTAIGNYFQKLDALINQHHQKHDKLSNIKKAMLEKMFPKQGKTIPEIRFKGFSGGWNSKILNDVCDVKDGTHSSPKFHQNGFPLITSKNVKNGFVNYDDIQYISKIDFDEINKRSKVDINDILMGMIGTIGNIALIRDIVDFAIKNVALIKNKNLIDFSYLYYFLQSSIIAQQLEDRVNGGTQKFISLNNVRTLLILSPEREEQNAIGNYFQKLDALINLHQQQITKLNNIKQACLNKMFV